MNNQVEEQTRIGHYVYNQKYCIGQGSYGKVFKGFNEKLKRNVAIKQIDGSLVTEQQINKQIQILKQFQHPNIVKYEDAFENNGYFYIITEFCNGGDLRNLLENSDEESEEQVDEPNKEKVDRLLDMFFQVSQGFNYLHRFNIIHRDLKPSNILIHNNVYKIADFGVARRQKLHKSLINNDLIGVPIYMSPQVLSKNFYTYKCDVWSLAIIAFEFYFQKLPWKAPDIETLFFQIMSHPTPYLEQKKKVPPILKNIFDHSLRYLERERYSWSELISLQKNRKKIFTDYTRTKSIHSEKKPTSYTDLSSSKFNENIPKGEAEIVHHIICQCQSLSQQIISLVGHDCYLTFFNTTRNYLIQGYHYRQCFVDIGFFLMKIAGDKLHLYLMELDCLEDVRILLIFLQLVHDIISLSETQNNENIKQAMGNSCRSECIEKYAASVISKINTYRLSEKRI